MCTASWISSDDGYALFFNRDEQRSRSAALPPTIQEHSGIRFIAPIDPEGGGTWIGVNEFGIAIALLNHYPSRDGATHGSTQSRGRVVINLMDLVSPAHLKDRIASLDLTAYRPFTLLMLASGVKVTAQWDGEAVIMKGADQVSMPITTSSFDTEEVCRRRIETFTDIRTDNRPYVEGDLMRYHQSRIPNEGAYSVSMDREDAKTLSFSRIDVTKQTIRFLYFPGAPASFDFNKCTTLTMQRSRQRPQT